MFSGKISKNDDCVDETDTKKSASARSLLERDIRCEIIAIEGNNKKMNMDLSNKRTEVNNPKSVIKNTNFINYGSIRNRKGIHFNDSDPSTFIRRPPPKAPSSKDYYQGPALVRPSIKTLPITKNRSNNIKYSINGRERPFLIRPMQVEKNRAHSSNYVFPFRDKTKLKSAPMQVTHYVHTSNTKTCNGSSSGENKGIRSEKDDSVLDAAIVLSSQFTTSNDARDSNEFSSSSQNYRT